MRRKYVVGNWKMNTTRKEALALAGSIVDQVQDDRRIQVVLCPPFPYLSAVAEVIKGSSVLLGGQNCHCESKGAFTGEVSPAMLVDVGCTYVILGHSERRRLPEFREPSEFVNRKMHQALAAGLHVIVCAGETLEERDAGQVQEVVTDQLRGSLAKYPLELIDRLVIAYEPVWAIGTGRTATPEQACEVHGMTRSKVGAVCGDEKAQSLSLLYGGSVNAANAATLLAQDDIDGVLVGGASLKDAEFKEIIKAATALT